MCFRRIAGRQLVGVSIFLIAATAAPTAIAATVCFNQNAPAPLEACIADNGTPRVYLDQSGTRQYQYYGVDSWGSVIWLNGTDVSHKYVTGAHAGTEVTPVSNTVTGSGSPSDPYIITNVTDVGSSGVRMTQRFTYVNGDRVIKKSWMLENTGSTTFNDLRFFHGGDTFFGGDDNARSWYDATLNMVYVTNPTFTDTGYMGFYANAATPFSHYFSGDFWVGFQQAQNSAQLSDTFDSNFLDAGYHLQWNRTTLAPNEVWSIEAFETWSPPGSVQVLSPAEQYVTPGTTVRKTFRVQNLDDTNAQSITLDVVATPAGWTASLPGGANITLDPLEAVEVEVDVQVPANASEGDSEEIYLTATANATTNTGMTRLSVPITDYTFSPAQLGFGNVPPNENGELEITLTNGPSDTIQIGQVGGANPLAAPYQIIADSCSNTSLAANASCTIRVRYAATSQGTYPEAFNVPVVAPTLVDHTIVVEGTAFVTHTVDVNVSGGSGGGGGSSGGSISPSTIEVVEGQSQSFTLTPDAGYRIAGVTGCNGTLVGDVYTVPAVTSGCSINVTFEPNAHPLAVSSGSGGSISPSSIDAAHGEQVTLTITPDAGYSIATVTGCGGTLSGNSYVTAPVTGACSVNATFTKTMTDVVVTGRTNGGGGSFELGTLLLGALFAALRRGQCRIGIAALAALAATGANAADVDTRDFYAGASLGRAASSTSASDLTRHLQSAGYDVQVSMDDDRVGWRVFAGWALNRYVAIEGGYTDLGEVTTGYSGSIAELEVQSMLDAAVAVHPRSAHGVDGSIVARYPFSARWSASAEIGAFFWDAERRVHDTVGRHARKDDDGVDLRYGLSVDANVIGKLDVIASWSRFELDSESIDLAGLGLRYRW